MLPASIAFVRSTVMYTGLSIVNHPQKRIIFVDIIIRPNDQ